MASLRSIFGRAPHDWVTVTGVAVKSYAVKQIADYLTANGIEYKRGMAARSMRFLSLRKVATPELYLPAFRVFVKYWGLVDSGKDITAAAHREHVGREMARYLRSGVRLISLYPSDLGHLDKSFQGKLQELAAREHRGGDDPSRAGRWPTSAPELSRPALR